MQYLLMLHFRAGEGPQEGTPEFDVEMALGRAQHRAARGRRRGRRQRPARGRDDDRARAGRAPATDWPQIDGLYAELSRSDPSPVVAVNRAVAVRFAEGPTAGLAILDGLAADARLDRYQPLHAARAELLRRIGDAAGADAAYGEAIALSGNDAERAALERRRREGAG